MRWCVARDKAIAHDGAQDKTINDIAHHSASVQKSNRYGCFFVCMTQLWSGCCGRMVSSPVFWATPSALGVAWRWACALRSGFFLGGHPHQREAAFVGCWSVPALLLNGSRCCCAIGYCCRKAAPRGWELDGNYDPVNTHFGKCSGQRKLNYDESRYNMTNKNWAFTDFSKNVIKLWNTPRWDWQQKGNCGIIIHNRTKNFISIKCRNLSR